mmetsp:Transcript_26277/g.30388  ORF Transcript_26277/g.30388 Transcript_26277/m.30388 type:complete len:151 (+) Transcript_26277:470-922(+)
MLKVDRSVKNSSGLDPMNNCKSTQNELTAIKEKVFDKEEESKILQQESSQIETVEGYTPKDNPVKSILKKKSQLKGSHFKQKGKPQNGKTVSAKPKKSIKFSDDVVALDSGSEGEDSRNTSSEDEDEVGVLYDQLNQCSYSRLSMFLISV